MRGSSSPLNRSQQDLCEAPPHLQLSVAFSRASSDWIVVGHFSVLTVFPSGSAAGKKTPHGSLTVAQVVDEVTGRLLRRAYVLFADFFALTLRWTLLWRLCAARLFLLLLLLLWRGMAVRLLLKLKESSLGELKQVWLCET